MRFLQIAEDYALLNPHLTLNVDWHGQRWEAGATDADWTKWKPSDPTSPHWYAPEHLERLIAAYIAHDADSGRASRTVRELVAEFRGLSGSAKQKRVLDETGFARTSLTDLVHDDAIDEESAERLLETMKRHSAPVKPSMLGIIGQAHLRRRMEETGCAMETFDYRKATGETDGLPWVIETAFAAFSEALEPDADQKPRRLITGVNWSPGIINPFRELGRIGESLDSVLSEQEAGADEPVVLLLHLACPRVEYMDRGKSSVVIGRAE
jgi:DNA topoisomerase VI subunit B